MRRFLTIAAMAAVFSALALAETWTGRLVDATCMQNQQNQEHNMAMCNPTSTTTSFALEVRGKTYDFDSAGNEKAQDALKNRAERSKNPNEPTTAHVTAKVTGTMQGNTIQVETIDIR